MEMYRIASAEMLPGLRLRLRFVDGFEGISPLADIARIGGTLAVIGQRPEQFTVADGGRSIVWTDADGDDVDLCADALRLSAEQTSARAAE